MEKQFEPSPAKFNDRYSSILIIVALSLFVSVSAAATATAGGGEIITERELENAIGALRLNGYTLFGNAIVTSDLRYQILSGDAFTFFAPRDSNLFSLDMSTDASDYVETLRYHAAPRRLSISDLRNLSSFGVPYLETLLPHHSVLICSHKLPGNNAVPDVVTVDGVRISHPDLYYGSRFSVHGLEGILSTISKYSERFPGELGFEHQSVSSPPQRIKNPRSKKRGKRHQNHVHRKRHQNQIHRELHYGAFHG